MHTTITSFAAVSLWLPTFSEPVEPPPVPLVSPDAVLVAQLDGPALFRQKLLPTDVGSMLATKEADALWRLVQEPLQGVVAAASSEPDADTGGALALAKSYGGRITLGVEWLGKSSSEFAGLLVLAPDGRTDLGALGTLVRRAIARSGTVERTATVGEREFAFAVLPNGFGLGLPVDVEKHLVIPFGMQIEAVISHVFAPGRDAVFRPDSELAASTFGMRVDLVQVTRKIERETMQWLQSPFAGGALWEVGLKSLRSLRVGVKPAGGSIRIETSVEFASREKESKRGVFGGLMPAIEGAPAMAAHVPPGFSSWQVVKHDSAEIARALIDATTALGLGVRQRLREGFGVDLDKDLLVHLTDEALVLGDLPLDGKGFFPVPAGLLVLFEVEDAEAFDAGLEAMKQGRFPILDKTPDHVDGVAIHSDRYVTHARFDKWFVLALGSEGRDRTERVIKHLRDPSAKAEAEGLSDLKRLRRRAPPGFHGHGQVEASVVSSLLLAMMPRGIARVIRPATEEFRRLLREDGRTKARMLTGFDSDCWRARVFW